MAVIPVFFLISFALGYLLYDLFGYVTETNNAPLWVDLVVAVVAVGVVLVPCIAADNDVQDGQACSQRW